MTNREWINKQCLYDILILMQKQRGFCIIEDLTNKLPKTCIAFLNSPYDSCEECIQKWLNQKKGGDK